MDLPNADPRLLDGALRTLEVLGRLPGAATGLRRLQRMILASGLRDVEVLDVGTGGGDVPRRLALWGRERGLSIRCTGLDYSVVAIANAKRSSDDGIVRFVAGDAARLPFGDRALDFVHTALLVHHLRDERAVVDFFRETNRVCRRGAVVHDLVRSRRAYVLVRMVTALCRNPYIRHDGPASVRSAFRTQELEALARQAGWRSPRIETFMAHRICMVLEKDRA